MGYALSITVERSFEEALEATRAALSDQGFGILTEIDLQATLKAKMDAQIDPQVILGACRPPLALAALQAEPAIGLLLPCNVVCARSAHSARLSRPWTRPSWSCWRTTRHWPTSPPKLRAGCPRRWTASRRP